MDKFFFAQRKRLNFCWDEVGDDATRFSLDRCLTPFQAPQVFIRCGLVNSEDENVQHL